MITESTQRGTVLRDTNQGPGIISINGQQHAFTLEAHWRSDKPPVAGSRVDATLSPDGSVEQLVLVDEAQIAKEKAIEMAGYMRAHGSSLGTKAINELGVFPLIALALLAVGWFALNLLSLQISSRQSVGFTFWELLHLANGDGDLLSSLQNGGGATSAGLYGFMAMIAILLPLLPMFWGARLANIGFAAPLAFMSFLIIRLYIGVQSGMSAVGDLGGLFGRQGASLMNQMASEMMSRALKAASLGLGFYLSVAAAAYLVYVGYKRFKKS